MNKNNERIRLIIHPINKDKITGDKYVVYYSTICRKDVIYVSKMYEYPIDHFTMENLNFDA